ncbi:dipeptidyl aminopeptidase/acylaminoacyl peptidase [Novosphingobium sp. SG751A]|uniref:alpha/beta hydrolase family protein n=1 Tax=Novosphingobium sp. SG751A TaxID=2587000 RepID=UPI001551B9AA|nr:prolyl oligopeptidase family serine peptidase [Novosphingobium sp. SG751A]NOW47033.1 dipeptidyl aminopeptidase/acylaminoacyl peptidase [Novosphingobium sp. SG751A]
MIVKQFGRACSSVLALAAAFGLGGGQAMAQDAAPVAAPVVEAEHRLDAADFAVLPFVAEPTLSPDGEWMGGLFAIGGQKRICAIGLFDGQSKPSCIGIPDLTEAHGLEWVNNDNLLVHLTVLQPVEGERFYVSRLINFNRVTGKITKLLWDSQGQSADRVLWTAHDGKPTALIAAQNSIYMGADFWPSIYRVNVETGSRMIVQQPRADVMRWFTDGEGVVRIGYGYDDNSRMSRVMYRNGVGESFKEVDRADGRKREDLISVVGFGSVPGSALIIHDDKDKHSALFEVDLATQKDLRTIWTAPEGSWIEKAWTDVDRKTVLGLRVEGKEQKRVWLDPALAETQAAFAKAVPDRRVAIVDINSNHTRMLVRIDAPDAPGAIYFYDTGEGVLHRLAYLSEKLKGQAINPVKMVRYKARDGLEIEAVLTLPKGKAAKNLPFVVMPHGGPWSHDTLDYDYWAQFVAQLGYGVIQPNFRGSDGYGEEFERKGEGQMGLAMQDDLNDALDWAVKEGIADGKRACLVGASYGGYATMWGLARDADLWRCGISISGVASVRREVNDMGNSLYGNHNRDAWSRMTPDFAAVSPINAVGRIKAPLLLVHGKMDVTVDHGQSASMVAKMREAGKPVEFVSLPKADHYFTREVDRLELLKAIEGFLKKNNPAD